MFVQRLLFFVMIGLVTPCCSFAQTEPVQFAIPVDPQRQAAVQRCANWLHLHIERGQLEQDSETSDIAIVAWKDPTLAPHEPNLLAGYAITDTLWAAKALPCFYPQDSVDLNDSLKRIGCIGNNLHEVLWSPLSQIHHRSADIDSVHGESLGTFFARSGVRVNVRSFKMKFDPDFSLGHPILFAEHAVYQSFFDFWNRNSVVAKDRIRGIFTSIAQPKDSPPQIYWNKSLGVLVDYVTKEQFENFQSKKQTRCRQYAFKIALILYAARFFCIEEEFGEEISQMQQRLWAMQLEHGGIAHFMDIDSSERVIAGLDATGEATAVSILATMAVPNRQNAKHGR